MYRMVCAVTGVLGRNWSVHRYFDLRRPICHQLLLWIGLLLLLDTLAFEEETALPDGLRTREISCISSSEFRAHLPGGVFAKVAVWYYAAVRFLNLENPWYGHPAS